jgi:hypothetical protein
MITVANGKKFIFHLFHFDAIYIKMAGMFIYAW